MKTKKTLSEMEFDENQLRLEWPDPIVKSSGFLWLEGTDIIGKTFAEVAGKVLATPNLRDLGIDEATVEEFAAEGDNVVIFKWVKGNIEPLYTIIE